MIKKLEIINVGRLRSLKTNGDNSFFKENTFIYGKNTFGKSTLTAIFRSLKENNPDYIVGRLSIGATSQSVKCTPETTTPVGEYRYVTGDSKWNSDLKEILIFDGRFVRESVYTQNEQIGTDQQKKIEGFMLGSEGAEYLGKIDQITSQISSNTQIQTSTNYEYSRNQHLLGGLSLDDFLNLSEIPEIEEKIGQVKKEIDTLKNSELITSKLNILKSILQRYETYDPSGIQEKLSVNSELISDHFKNHINPKESKQTFSTFLQVGSKLRLRLANEVCPFCTQAITDKKIMSFLETVDLVFNEKYRNIQQSLKNAEVLFSQETFLQEVEKIKTDLQQIGYLLEVDLLDVGTSFESCKKTISDKRDDLSSVVNIKPFTDISSAAKDHIGSINAELKNFLDPSEKRKNLEKSLTHLQASKERFGSWREKCEAYLKAKKSNEDLGATKKTIWESYLSYANSLSSSVLADINAVLGATGCNFKVERFNFQGNQRQDLFVLAVDGNQISNTGNDREKTVKNSLSDSDKWILALSFFLAKVKNDQTAKIVVMDDPVSSFDSDRKRVIIKEIKKVLGSGGKQLILLTHEKGFYHVIFSEYKGLPTSAFLKLIHSNETGSSLIPCNPNEDIEFISEFNVWISRMKGALSSYDESEVKQAHACIRPVIEHILKSKYPLELTIDLVTVERMVAKLEESGGSYSINSPRTKIDDILTNTLHHDNSGVGQYPASQLGIEDCRRDIAEAFNLFKVL